MTQPLPGADAWLVDDRWSKAYALGPETHIGRSADSSIILRDPVISRRHATVVRDGDGYSLRCFGSAGARVNGQDVTTSCALQEGDIIEIAFTHLRFTMMAPTGEMFVVARDVPTEIDRMEGPTRATVKAAAVEPSPAWRRVLIVVMVVLALLVLVALIAMPGSG